MTTHPKKLVFHFYAYRGWENSPIYRVHEYFLKKYRDIFDFAEFYIAVNDVNDDELIGSVEHFIVGVGFKDIRFHVQENTWMRESETMKQHVIDKLKGNDCHIFFAHNKGVMDYARGGVDTDALIVWITALYFLNLEYYKEAEWAFLAANSTFFGGLMELYNGNNTQRYLAKNNWVYCGTFYWINCPELLSRYGDELPYPHDRFYSENFPGNLCKSYDLESYSHNYMMVPSWKFERIGTNYESVYGRVKCLLDGDEMIQFDSEVDKVRDLIGL